MVNRFIEFENKYDLFNLKIDDFEVWAYIRFDIYFAIGKLFNITNGTGSTPKTTLVNILSMLKYSFFRNPLYSLKKYDILMIPHQRRILEDGKYKCLYTDSLAERIPHTVSAEFLFGKSHYNPPKTKNIIYLDYVDVWPSIKYRCYYHKKIKSMHMAQVLCTYVKEFFGVELRREDIERLIHKRYFGYKYKKPIIKQFLRRVSPKIIIELVGYETNKMIINEVAHEMGIPCVELQHGVMGKGHIAYNYRTGKELKQLPTHLFVYSKYWKETCSVPIQDDRVVVTGFPYMEEQIKKYPYQKGGKKHRIIIYSSTDSTKSIRDFTQEIIKLMNQKQIDYSIIYKLHPLEYNYDHCIWKSIQASPNVIFVDTPEKSLYQLCAMSDVQVGVKTTAIFEGLSYGLKTFVLHTGAPDIDLYMGDLVKQGYAIYGKTPEDFVEFLLQGSNGEDTGEIRSQAFFTPNAISNIEQQVERIIAENEGRSLGR